MTCILVFLNYNFFYGIQILDGSLVIHILCLKWLDLDFIGYKKWMKVFQISPNYEDE